MTDGKYTLDITKGEILRMMVKVLFWFCLPLTIYSWSRYFKVGFLPVMALHGFLLIILFIAFLRRENIRDNILAHTIVIIFLGIAFGGIPTRGQLIYGIPGGIFATAFATFLFNKQVATRYLVLQVLVVSALGIIFGQPDKRFQSIFELISYTVFQYFLINSLEKLRSYMIKMIRDLDSAVQAKARFLANMSHEIRTPLNGIVLASESLDDDRSSENIEEMVNVISKSSSHLSKIINEILDYSKMENDKIKINKDLVNVNGFLGELTRDFDHQATHRGLEFQVFGAEESDYFYTDPYRLEQILRNLISNALKFTHSGSVTLEYKVLKGESIVQFRVKDTGIGIAPDRLSNIFDEFEQESIDTTRNYGGTGLGLAIVRGLCLKLEGKVEVSSEQGKGSAFLVSLPYDNNVIEDKLKLLRERKVLEKGVDKCIANRNSSILIVEDNEVNIQVLTKRLERLGFTNILVAHNGAAALEVLNNQSCDIVLMDIQMPILNGLEATSKIRAGEVRKENSNIPVIGLSANSFDIDREAGFAVGMNDYIGKPLSLSNIIEVLNKYLI